MDSSKGLCLVSKGAPRTATSLVSVDQYHALRDFVIRGKEPRALIDFLDEVHARGQWIVCDCLGPTTAMIERPALTVARSPKSKLYLRNLISRKPHAEKCIFRYTSAPQDNKDMEPQTGEGLNLCNGVLNLHQSQATGMADSTNADSGSGRSKAPYPRLGQVLLHLMRESGMLRQTSSFDFLEALNGARAAAQQMLAFPQTRLDEVLYFSVRQEQEMKSRISDMRHQIPNAYGMMVVIVHRIDERPFTLIRENKSASDWRCTPQGNVTMIGRRSISKGPFIAAITFAPNNGETEVVPQHCFVIPILGNSKPLPVESDLERSAANSIVQLMAWAEKNRSQTFVIDKPMYDISVGASTCRPDFIVQGPGGQVVVEVMGMMDDAEYRERKERTVPLMAMLGEVIEVAPDVGLSSLSNDQLKDMNRKVLRAVGAKR